MVKNLLNLSRKKSPHLSGAGFFSFSCMRQPAPLPVVMVVVIMVVFRLFVRMLIFVCLFVRLLFRSKAIS